MTRIRRAITLAYCTLLGLGLPLPATARSFQPDSGKYEFERHLDSEDTTASWRDTLSLETGRAAEDRDWTNLIDLLARRGDVPAGIHELIFGNRETSMEDSERSLEEHISRHSDFFRHIRDLHADGDAFRSRLFRHGRHRGHDRARMHWHHERRSNLPPVPEPSSAILIGIGLIGLAVARRRQDA
jgi:hypothetical protein